MINLKGYHDPIFYLLLLFMVVILIFVADTLSISYKESLTFFNEVGLLNTLSNFSTSVFGQNNIALRLPFILFYTLSSIIMYSITKDYFKTETDRLISTLLFMVLPGVVSASLLVHNTIIVIFCILIYLYYYKIYQTHNYFLLFLFLFIDNSFAIFYLALFFYSLRKKENTLIIVSLLLFGLSMQIYGFDSSGKPRGHFLDTFTIYASIFSPMIFLYYIYVMYRIGLKGTKTIYWYISVTALVFSLLFSFRQRIQIEDFAPYVVVTLPIIIKYFLHNLRVRLPQFRHRHYNWAYLSLFLLFISVVIILFNKPLYLFIKKPQSHFAYKYHFAYEISEKLKEKNINYVTTNYKLENRLNFYGIKSGEKYLVTLNEANPYFLKIPIEILDKKVLNVYVLKLSSY
ncbi:hypothetical protein A9Q76_10105 [Arcobacter sp. 31_11_sub10_T18]|nr:hypothetical protein A9Q76_10105 [Arcobacter sp. 31_11_sub10_T18]